MYWFLWWTAERCNPNGFFLFNKDNNIIIIIPLVIVAMTDIVSRKRPFVLCPVAIAYTVHSSILDTYIHYYGCTV